MRRIESLYALFIVLLFLAALVLPLTTKDGIPHVFAGPVEGAASGEALVPSTPQDFVMPGSQPETLTTPLGDPSRCMGCHAIYGIPPEQSPEQRTWQAWQGSMMAQAGRDPLFFAALDVANAGAANAGEFCLRCHMPRGWLAGRSSTPDASEMTAEDQEGVQCEVCHRLVDPVPDPANPARDEQILAALDQPVVVPGSGQMIVDPEDFRRGPFNIMADLGLDVDPHLYTGGTTAVSPFHQDSALCGTCHDINNPMFTWNEASQTYVPNELDAPADIAEGFPIERTYSEWLLSDFSTPPGIELPKFGGNNAFVSTCQDCHMRAITGSGGGLFGNNGFVRDNMPLHDLTGGNTWVPQIIPLHPDYAPLFSQVVDSIDGKEYTRGDYLANGVERARQMLRNAARLEVAASGAELTVTVYNDSGHKLPTGYVEGRRMWLQVEGYDQDCNLIYTSGAYDATTATLDGYHTDPSLKVYESKQGLTQEWANTLGLAAGPTFHFALNNLIVSDNRIPPRGYNFVAFNGRQAAPYTDGKPDPAMYADGQYWDTITYDLPEAVAWGNVRLFYQTASKEYIEFLRDNNPNEGRNNGDILYDLWQQSGRSTPELMTEARFGSGSCQLFLPAVNGS